MTTTTPTTVSLLPLSAADHAEALQQVYRATPAYWQRLELPGAPAGQARRDLEDAAAMPGRSLMGIVQPAPDTPGVELVGLVDFRLHWPEPQTVYVGMVMVAAPYQRRGIGRAAWRLLRPWLAGPAGMLLARTAVEQFNPGALKFFQALGFALTGSSCRMQMGSRWVRLLYLEQPLASEPVAAPPIHSSPTV
jgi:RimJ/RimL family protein N-acetyltransferase